MADNQLQPNKSGKKELTMEQRLLLAFVLMGLVLFLTPYFYKAPPPPPKTATPPSTQTTADTTLKAAAAESALPNSSSKWIPTFITSRFPIEARRCAVGF